MLNRQLRYELQVKKNRVQKAYCLIVVDELILFFDFLRKNAMLRGLLEELHQGMPKFEDWFQKMQSQRRVVLPETEKERVQLCLAFLEHCLATKNEREPINIAHATGCYETHLSDNVNFFLEHFFMPFYEYLDQHIEEYSSVLYIIEKFKLRTQLFDRERLFKLYTADKSKGEKILDQTIRQYLFDQGIEYPFSTPASPSGRADIVANLLTPEPVIIEIKLFNPDGGYDKNYIRKGFRQVHDYVQDYNKTVGYLVIFNVCDKDLQFKLTLPEYPFRIVLGDKVIYLVVVDIFCDERPASKRGPLEPYIIEESYLTSIENECFKVKGGDT